MPIVASVGGNTGNQTTALAIRAIAMGQATAQSVLRMVREELGIGLVNGVLLGIVVALLALVFYQNVTLGAVIAIAMLLNLLLAAFVRLAVPVTLDAWAATRPSGRALCLPPPPTAWGLVFLGLATLILL